MLRPLQHAVYKGMGGKFGALQFNLQDPHYYEVEGKRKDFTGHEALDQDGKLKEGWRIREGCIFLDACSAKGKNIYDWENKVIMALSTTDMGKLAFALTTGDGCKILHDPGAKTETQGVITKALNVASPQGVKAGALLSISKTAGGETTQHQIPLNGEEVLVLTQLLRSAISRSLGWA